MRQSSGGQDELRPEEWPISRFLIWLSGARPEILELCPTERGKYTGLGSAVLITSVIAGISAAFAVSFALKVPPAAAVAIGIGWGLAIMSLDRLMVVTTQRRKRLWQTLLPAVIRLGLAVLLGLIISTPFVLQIFRPEIEAKIAEMQQVRADEFQRNLQQGSLTAEITRLEKERADLQRIIESGGEAPSDPASDPKIKALTAQLDKQRGITQEAYQEWQCQLYGLYEGRKCKKGNGPLAQEKEKEYRDSLRAEKDLEKQIEERKQALADNDQRARSERLLSARQRLPDVEEELAALRAQRQAQQRAFAAKNQASDGLLQRIEALGLVSSEDSGMAAARWLLLLFITVIECLPVLVKLLLLFGPPDGYEQILAMQQQAQVRAAAETVQRRWLSPEAEGEDVLTAIWPRQRQDTGPGTDEPPPVAHGMDGYPPDGYPPDGRTAPDEPVVDGYPPAGQEADEAAWEQDRRLRGLRWPRSQADRG